ncbi:hypothetical protein P152DRAFT_457601 [Eremomyces bilateralis CBS 781.70]|uniref:Uncharacterized protein n=1 Tax=Eremomyces bilateralis CBS 781.70 TaxID=1392243 RepID=A0A6G1G5T7_9PEZI|nr:uncharacterized protein P152DRAFT_457601 [Eremomyces bilateralis CBS 781.70]KAF1813240.1 hypothetical protein P152DRAFT_457601 [Eremomyces bilateralis CBS 781.70]
MAPIVLVLVLVLILALVPALVTGYYKGYRSSGNAQVIYHFPIPCREINICPRSKCPRPSAAHKVSAVQVATK